ncbi:hypothetical protein M3J09_001608 [Ascochyta lentis]
MPNVRNLHNENPRSFPPFLSKDGRKQDKHYMFWDADGDAEPPSTQRTLAR